MLFRSPPNIPHILLNRICYTKTLITKREGYTKNINYQKGRPKPTKSFFLLAKSSYIPQMNHLLRSLKENKMLVAMATDSPIKMDHKVGEKKTLWQYRSLERSFILFYIGA